MKIITFLSYIASLIGGSKSFPSRDSTSLTPEIGTTSMCNVLSFSGGGAFGAVEVGILDAINLPAYDMITGVSAGGLNAGFLSYFNSDNNNMQNGIDNLKNIYSSLTNDDVYKHGYGQLLRTWSYYDTTPLELTLARELSKLSYPLIQSKKRHTLIGSTNVNSGLFDIFKFEEYNKIKQLDILMATSAIPLVFPPREINNNYYIDGGVIANEIVSGISSYLECDKYNITFITASTPLSPVSNFTGLTDYTSRIVKLFLSDFNNELVEIISDPCNTSSRGTINYCYPTDESLVNFSMLDFTHGAELYNIGLTNFKCNQYNFC
jgi:predicted patatin/cPLA2 family phospholipase